jgi:hypothetical protein
MQAEANIKRQLMEVEFNYNMQLAQTKSQGESQKESEIEDRKDARIKMQGTQESQLIDQRKNNLLPTDFESIENDNLNGFGLSQFGPQ